MVFPAEFLIVESDSSYRLFLIVEGNRYCWQGYCVPEFMYDAEEIETCHKQKLSLRKFEQDWDLTRVAEYRKVSLYKTRE